jgi:POT family proton-dependent oligopeptide transporter
VTDVYTTVGWVAIGAGVLIILISPLFKRLMHIDTLGDDEAPLAGKSEIGEPAAAGVHTERELKA